MITIAAASGNVFGYIWAREAPSGLDGASWAKAICPRGKGLGLDGLFLLQDYQSGQPWVMDHWEPDGQRTFCSNGTRAAAAMLPPQISDSFSLSGETISVCSSGEFVSIKLRGDQVGLRIPEGGQYGLRDVSGLSDLPYAFGFTGTPHLILEMPTILDVDLARFAPPLRHHPALPDGANVSIIEILEEYPQGGRARIRTWERGVEGETLCCGQGCAVAGVWLAKQSNILNWQFLAQGEDPVNITLEGLHGDAWRGLWLSGPVRRIGRFEPEQPGHISCHQP